MIVDQIENWEAYPFGSAWTQAFAYLADLNAGSEEGEYPIDGDAVFARIMSYETKRETDEDAILEAHRKFVDIQMALVGSERIARYPAKSLEPKGAYDDERDVQFFNFEHPADTQASVFPGTFVCLLPNDAHMPQLKTGSETERIKKVVVKLAIERLRLP